jgi:outer membrane immunogenic protein
MQPFFSAAIGLNHEAQLVRSGRLAAWLLVALLGTTNAAAATSAAPYSWTGCYLGIEGGSAWGKSQQYSAGAPSPATLGLPLTDRFDVAGALLGGTIGCNYQIASVVLGIEDDMSWINAKGSALDIPPFSAGAISATNEQWIDTLRGRVGWAWDRLLVYGTGGIVFADVGVIICRAVCVSDSQTRKGWTAGAGVEWVAWNGPGGDVTLKLEYLHADIATGLFHLSARSGKNGQPQRDARRRHLRSVEYLYYGLDGGPSLVGGSPLFPRFPSGYSWRATNLNVVRGGVSYKF